MYWANATRIPVIADGTSRSRFEILRTMIYTNDNFFMKQRDDPESCKLFEIRLFVESIRSNF